jgi:integrase
MPILIDEDLRYEDERGPRPTVAANQWLRELPVSGAPSPNSWETYARPLRDWLVFLTERGVSAFGDREPLRAALALYAGYRLAGPLEVRLAEASWNLHITAVASFYDWAVEEGHATAVPFTFGTAKRIVQGRLIEVRRNMAKIRAPKAHTTIKYLEQDFADLLVRVVEGLLPDGSPDPGYRGHHPGRNAAMVRLVLSSGLRRQEFTHLLAPEIPPLPPAPTVLPILFPVAAGPLNGVSRWWSLKRTGMAG